MYVKEMREHYYPIRYAYNSFTILKSAEIDLESVSFPPSVKYNCIDSSELYVAGIAKRGGGGMGEKY